MTKLPSYEHSNDSSDYSTHEKKRRKRSKRKEMPYSIYSYHMRDMNRKLDKVQSKLNQIIRKSLKYRNSQRKRSRRETTVETRNP